ncbi:MAG: tRNA (adenosine(37)-N6)-threonylcarbamoyltransferase complex transferase subunit TsaD [Planctomycetota bacterium]|nr:tRNA (adenosine(37)-N6)-threonylcarbamoyltransferase complex transferase subunit TsaD [Planctomycetota bacterium]
MLILGIDTSCDDTAAGVLRGPREVLSNEVATQFDLHAAFGGVVPEIASRAHTERITRVIERAVEKAGITLRDLDAIAVTNRPGLVGALIVGVSAAKSLALTLGIPLVGVHHIEAHCTAALAEHPDLAFPFLALVASGGHTALYDCRSPLEIEVVGQTIDDAAGECFDKVAVMLDLPQPGGPSVSKLAEGGNPKAVRFPRARVKSDPLAFSFSGVKTSVLYHLKGPGGRRDAPDRDDLETTYADVAASFEQAVVDALVTRSLAAVEAKGYADLVVGGGVAANQRLRADLAAKAPAGVHVRFPSMGLCADNGAMIALRGAQLLAADITSELDLDVSATGEPGALL